MKFKYSDGGRRAAGYKNKKTNDCVVRAVAIALRLTYNEAFAAIAPLRRKPKTMKRYGVSTSGHGFVRFMASHGYFYVNLSPLKKYLGYTPLPSGRILVETPGHISAVINGVLHDSFNAAAGEPWKILGFWRKTKFSDVQRKQFDKLFRSWHITP